MTNYHTGLTQICHTVCEFNANANLQVQFDTFSYTVNLKILPMWYLNRDPNTKFKACNSNTACINSCDDKIQTTSLSSSQILKKGLILLHQLLKVRKLLPVDRLLLIKIRHNQQISYNFLRK